MPKPTPDVLTDDQITAALVDLPGWSRAGNKLAKTYKFADFKEAMGFIVRVGFEAEALGHHPELFNVYSTVKIELCTHDAGGKITALDTTLAGKTEALGGAA